MVLSRCRPLAAALLLAASACAPIEPRVGIGIATVDLAALPTHASLTVLVFFSPRCHCLTLHEPRLKELFERYHPRGVDFVMVDSETDGSAERDAQEAVRRGYRFPIVRDPGARLAEALGAQYATYSVVLDAQGRLRYRGGIDTDRSHLHDDAQPYLKDAIEDLLSGRSPRVAEGKTLGCALRTW
jgi:hypothetical protein